MVVRRISRWTVPFLITAALTLIFFYQLAFTDRILGRGDTFAYFYPYWHVRDAALQAGQLPLWSPDLFMGVPLMANPQLGTFYLPNWLTISMDAPDAIRISILLHVVWAMLGAYALARRALDLDRIPALSAGAIFAFGGFVGAHVEQINQLQGLSWMPWLFVLFHAAVGAQRAAPLRIIVLMGIAWALQLLSGHTQTAFITGVGLGVYGVMFNPSPPAPLAQGEQGENGERRSEFPPHLWGRGFKGGGMSNLLSTTLRSLILLMVAAILAVILAAPQLIPTQELISLSNRGDGFNRQEATAFSLNPFLVGRGLLPSYDAQPFGEYVGYGGVIGLGLAVVGAFTSDRRRWVWLILAGAGLFLAFGRHNPLYWTLADLPGFNLFRVPARWLALYTLGLAMLAGVGVQSTSSRGTARHVPTLVTVGLVLLLAGLSLLSDRAADEVDGSALPTLLTWIGWGAALVVFVAVHLLTPPPSPLPVDREGESKDGACIDDTSAGSGVFIHRLEASSAREINPSPLAGRGWGGVNRQRTRHVVPLLVLLLAELWLASQFLPYNDVTDPAIYHDRRFAVNQMQVYGEDQTPPGRLLTISGLLFDPGDRGALERRWDRLGLSDRAARYAFTATKMQETLTPNLPLVWGVPSADGFDGGVLPTLYYTQFTSLLLPENTLRTVDGRLYQVLAQPACRGACIPEDRWLDLMNVQYLLTDKVYDLWHEDIAYDTQFVTPLAAGETLTLDSVPEFEATGINVLYTCADESACAPTLQFDAESQRHRETGETIVIDGLQLAQYGSDAAAAPETITITALDVVDIHAMTLVDTRTGDFVQLTPPGWERVYSADIKIYENLDVMPRAFLVYDAVVVPDTYAGTEQALTLMRDPGFDPAQTVVLHTDEPISVGAQHSASLPSSNVEIIEYTRTRIVIEVETSAPGYLVLTDAFYPGWIASDGDSARYPMLRADVMFRAVRVEAGQHRVQFSYNPLRR